MEKHQKPPNYNDIFAVFSERSSDAAGSALAFFFALILSIVWIIGGYILN